MHKLGTQIARLLKVSGKACAQSAQKLWGTWGQKNRVSSKHKSTHNALWITRGFTPTLYTKCIHTVHSLVGKSTSVISEFYTLYTPLTTMTTTYINTIRRNA
jgi:hypothetical protein